MECFHSKDFITIQQKGGKKMKHKMLIALGLIALVMVVFAAIPAGAMTGYPPWFSNTMPAWDQTLPAYTRFVVLLNMNSEAVLDKETGLVWQKNLNLSVWDWYSAQNYCNNLYLGGRKGWRLPTLQELESLVDSTQSNPALPISHPFTNVFSFFYWTATTSAQNTSNAWLVKMSDGSEDDALKGTNPGFPAWCVRGGQGVDPQ
jgi:hypothetical protein